MRKLYDRLLSLLNISGRDLAVFLLALLLAFSIWLIHNLSLKYNAYLDIEVQAKCNIDGHSAVSPDKCNVIARCRATGYNVIKSRYKGKRMAVEVEFLPEVMKHKEGDLFYVVSSDLQEYAHLIYGDGVTVEYFTSDTLFYRFPMENYKRVPVQPVYTISYQSQHINEGPMEVRPDSVTVYGESFFLDNITKVYTEPIRFHHLSDDVQGEVRLDNIRGMRISEETVHYSLKVSRYVEMKRTLDIGVLNVPDDKSMTVFPSDVDVTIKCVFPLMDDPLEDITATADYLDFQQSLSGKCRVYLTGLPRGVISYELSPEYVETIVEEIM